MYLDVVARIRLVIDRNGERKSMFRVMMQRDFVMQLLVIFDDHRDDHRAPGGPHGLPHKLLGI